MNANFDQPRRLRRAADALDAIRNVSQVTILMPGDVANMQAAIDKRNRKTARKALNAAKTRQTTDARLVIRP